jgi:hypothetical protein
MKPRTKLHFEVWDLHKYIPEPKQQEPFMISKHEFYFTTHYNKIVCLECNHQWKPNQVWHEEVVGVECPSCKKDLKKIKTQNGGLATKILTFSVAQVVDRFQVVRYFSCWKEMSKKKPPYYNFRALFEEWKDWEKNKRVIIGRTRGWTGDGFNSTTYEIRNPNGRGWSSSDYDRFSSDFNCPGATFLTRFEKYQLTSFDHGCDWRQLIDKVQNHSKIETLLKAKQKRLLVHAVHRDSNSHYNYWSSIKIAIRNNYIVKDASIWYDYLKLLRFFGKDLHSPKYVCPKNLHKEHNFWMKKKQKIDEINRLEEERLNIIKQQQKIEKLEAEYIKTKNKFFDLEFKQGDITISLLKNVKEFQEEGTALNHCVYTNDYYSKKDSLIFSAKVKGKRTETIEFIISKMKVDQARGFSNDLSKQHDQILELFNKNISKISEIINPKKVKNLKPRKNENHHFSIAVA